MEAASRRAKAEPLLVELHVACDNPSVSVSVLMYASVKRGFASRF